MPRATVKTPAKKAPVKRTAAKKAPTKKVVRRQRKPIVLPVPEELSAALMLTGGEEAQATADALAAARESRSTLAWIEILDLRGESARVRFAVINELEREGYLFAHRLNAPMTECFTDYMNAETLRLQHNNKLVYTENFWNVSESRAISRAVMVNVHQDIIFSEPSQAVPDQVYVAGRVYSLQK